MLICVRLTYYIGERKQAVRAVRRGRIINKPIKITQSDGIVRYPRLNGLQIAIAFSGVKSNNEFFIERKSATFADLNWQLPKKERKS